MVTLLITSTLLLGILVVALYFWQKPKNKPESNVLPPRAKRGLFTPEESSDLKTLASSTNSESRHETAALLERAASGDKNALRDAHVLGDRNVYDQVLDLLTDSADTEPKLLALVSFLTRADLPVNTRVARSILGSWQKSPDSSATAKMLHIVALANDASLYNHAVDATMRYWREGRLPDVSTLELRSLFEGEFWLLSSQVRRSGAGFGLKRTLACARRELEAQTSINQ
jgi:hypothetical protein